MIECDVIRDLMPLYAEGLASEATRRAVETHTVCCPGCRRQLEAMCTPLEPDLTEENKNYIRAIREQNEKNIRQTLKGCAVVLLACLLVWWAYMEINFSGEMIDFTVMEESRILKEEPRLALSEEEKLIGEALLGMESIQALMETGQAQTIPFAEVEPEIRKWVPTNVEFDDIGVFKTGVYYGYRTGDTVVFLSYGDAEDDGILDSIVKTLATAEKPGGTEVKETYELHYNAETGKTEYRKYKTRHAWFGFLNLP